MAIPLYPWPKLVTSISNKETSAAAVPPQTFSHSGTVFSAEAERLREGWMDGHRKALWQPKTPRHPKITNCGGSGTTTNDLYAA